jgi:hypothetical protein
MRLVVPRSATGTFARLAAAAILVAVVAVGAPLHAHDIASGGDAAQKAQCAACVVGANPGLVLAPADFVPSFDAIDVVSVAESDVVTLSVAVRPGRAPPAA